MEVKLSEEEILALIELKKLLREAGTPTSQFFHWIADRLTRVHDEPEQVDFVQKLRDYGDKLYDVSCKLGIDRGPRRIP